MYELSKFYVSTRLTFIAIFFSLWIPQVSCAQVLAAWPNAQTIRFIVPFTPGSGTDIIARILANKLNTSLGTTIVIENKPGAGGTIGAAMVAKANPDGYTFLIQSSGHVVNPFLYTNLPYDTLKDFVGITPLAQLPNVLVTSPMKGYKGVEDLVSKVQAEPGTKNYASAGNGSATHMNAEKFRLAAKINANHIPYKGTPEAITDTIAGRVDWFFSPIVSALPLIKDGKLQPLAVGSNKRSSALPNVPTTVEAGVLNSSYIFWVGIFAPAKTPKNIIDKLNEQVLKILKDPEVIAQMNKLGAEPLLLEPAKFDQMIKSEMDANAILVKESKMSIN